MKAHLWMATAAMGIVAASPAIAQRSVSYFIMHTAERQDVLQSCYGGVSSRLHDAECRNANQAGYWILKAEAQNAVNSNHLGNPNYPEYYSANPIARRMTLNDCIHPVPGGIHSTPQQCQAARISAGLF